MPGCVRRLKASGLHDRLDIELRFFDDINILYGKNGSGKTTVLHILANILNGSFERFAYLTFTSIEIFTSEGRRLTVLREYASSKEEYLIRVLLDHEERDVFSNTGIQSIFNGDRANLEAEQASRRRWKSIVERLNIGQAEYFPAFRTMIEAWSSREGDENYRRTVSARALAELEVDQADFYATYAGARAYGTRAFPVTRFARRLFGPFVPPINYPSTVTIASSLSEELRRASYHVASESRRILSNAFIQVFGALSNPTKKQTVTSEEAILENIRLLLTRLDTTRYIEDSVNESTDVYTQLRELVSRSFPTTLSGATSDVLSVYQESLQRQIDVQIEAYERVKRYIDSVNDFLEGKEIKILPRKRSPNDFRVVVEFSDRSIIDLQALSSGEREIVSMLYAASHTGAGNIVLIDEPELSLHVDWQRLLLPMMMKQLGNRQIIVCTHSPMIGADFMDKYQEIVPQFYGQIGPGIDHSRDYDSEEFRVSFDDVETE